MQKERLDILLTQKGIFPTREKAKAAIMAGIVRVNGQKVEKAGTLVESTAELSKVGGEMPYVSRGGLKLEKALQTFPVSVRDKVVLDVGASTGGFTHCALLNGAQKVYAVDVGYGQLAWQLRQDDRVIVMERVNVRYLTPDQLGEQADFSTIDVSFVSLHKVLPAVKSCLKSQAEIIALIKPQFEAGKERVGKKGVVRDPEVHRDVILKVLSAAHDLGFNAAGLTFSPVTGPEGNIEYLTWLSITSQQLENLAGKVDAMVATAHRNFKG